MSEKEQQKSEMLSAFMDAEQSDIETVQIINALLNEPEYKEKFIRSQLIHDSLSDQMHESLLNNNLPNRISAALEELPTHYVDEAVTLQVASTESVTQSAWFRQLLANKVVGGLSVAASVMFATLFTLQHFDSTNNDSATLNNNTLVDSRLPAPSLIQAPSELPANLAATSAGSATSDNIKQQYRWIEADPELSRQIRQYINENDTHRAAYSLQPKVRAATYQISE